ncbi:MAG: hypothetical protein JKY32_05125, partial [Rhizobiales bacterium]|nr:hypothetical protein [Hyphomicrobiales bacterium]
KRIALYSPITASNTKEFDAVKRLYRISNSFVLYINNLNSDTNTLTLCTKCGKTVCGTSSIKFQDGVCSMCINKTTVIKKKLTLSTSDGRLLSGTARRNYLSSQKRLEKIDQEFKQGKRFKCHACKKFVLNKSMSLRKGCCKGCAKYFSEMKEDIYLNSNEAKVVREQNKALNSSEKEERAKNEQDLIAKFLASKNKKGQL